MGLRILWSSNAPWCATGYGGQSGHLLPRFQKLGHTCAVHAWHGLLGGTIQWQGMPILPAAVDKYGNDIVVEHATRYRADLVISLIDLFVLDPARFAALPCPWLPWFPVDHTPVSPALLARARVAAYPTCYARWGVDQMAAAGIACHYVPHGVDTRVYTPGDQAAARKALGFPAEGFIATMVAANKGVRKAFPEQLRAFAAFHQRHPDAHLYIHAEMTGVYEGLHLPTLAAAVGLPDDAVLYPNQYDLVGGFEEEVLAAVYQASDVLLGATMAEGFGIPIVEAQACGTPVITTDFSAMPELTCNGMATKPLQQVWITADPRVARDHYGWQVLPSVEAIRYALECIASRTPKERARQAERGVAFVREHYDWDVVVDQSWRPLLERVEADLQAGRGARALRTAAEAVPA